MNDKSNQLFTLFLVFCLAALTACQSGQPTAAPTPTFTVKPPPTQVRLPPAITPTPAEPTPTNTLVIQASYTPKPSPTDTPLPEPTFTDIPAPEVSPSATLPVVDGGAKIDWDDAEGEPKIIPGQDEGYFVWTDGDRVYIMAATKQTKYFFSGQAIGNGAIVNIDQVSQEGIKLDIGQGVNQVGFQWMMAGGPEGLHFTFTGTNLFLSLYIDGEPTPEPNLVFVGPDKRRVANNLELVR